MDIEHVSSVAAKRIQDYILYNKDGNLNTEIQAAKRARSLIVHLKGIVPRIEDICY